MSSTHQHRPNRHRSPSSSSSSSSNSSDYSSHNTHDTHKQSRSAAFGKASIFLGFLAVLAGALHLYRSQQEPYRTYPSHGGSRRTTGRRDRDKERWVKQQREEYEAWQEREGRGRLEYESKDGRGQRMIEGPRLVQGRGGAEVGRGRESKGSRGWDSGTRL